MPLLLLLLLAFQHALAQDSDFIPVNKVPTTLEENVIQDLNQYQNQYSLEARSSPETLNDGNLFQIQSTQILNLQKLLNELDKMRLHNVHTKELEDVREKLDRLRYIRKEIGFGLAEEWPDEVRIGLLGNSSINYEHIGINEAILSKLFNSMSAKHPKAVFFIGNLVYGLEHPGVKVDTETAVPVTLETRKNLLGTTIDRQTGVYDSNLFKKQLQNFSKLVLKFFPKTPFYPVVGEHEILGPGALDIFMDQFKVNQAKLIDNNQLAYEVGIGNASFTVISTNYYSLNEKKIVEDSITNDTLDWLSDSLNQARHKYKYLFTLGNSPAFSTTAASGVYYQLDRDKKQRDHFWRILMENKVLAYFCSDDVLYDRSYRYGVWQIITGGAGASYDLNIIDETFYHYVILTIPQKGNGNPKVEVFDIHGVLQDTLILKPSSNLLFQFRISRKIE